ncbi:acyltransferase family protein [Aeromonas veronii]|uniref:acyltransferase family protein n=1 Tax=Aeromonas veronii TaxID=654 RepID=UPI003F7BAD0E
MTARLESLDVLRGVAALLVLFYHMEELSVAVWPHIFYWGWVGVDLFFVLSGFFICLCVIRPREWKVINFLKRRFLRIAPPYYVSMLLTITFSGFYFITTSNGIVHTVAHLLFIHSYLEQTHGSINGAYWSLGVEFSFYIFMAVTACFLRSTSKKYIILFCMFIVAWLWRYIIYLYFNGQPMQEFIWSTQVIGMLDEFAIGCFIAFVYADCLVQAKHPRNYVAFLLLITGFILIVSFVKNLDDTFWIEVSSMVFSRTYLALGFGMIIFAFIMLERNKWFVRLCRWSGLSFIGMISFSIYLYHMPIINAANQVKGMISSPMLLSTSIIVMVLFMGSFSFYFIERRFMR